MGVDQERKRVSLTMVKPGTERHRGQQAGGARRGTGPGGEPRERDRDNRGPGQGQRRRRWRRRARPARPAGSALTSPPVGAPSVAVLAETPSRRPDRDRAGASPGRRRRSPHRVTATALRTEDRPAGIWQRTPSPRPRARTWFRPPPVAADRAALIPDKARAGGRPPVRTKARHHGPRAAHLGPPPRLLHCRRMRWPAMCHLRTFGQLKQLWEAKSRSSPDYAPRTASRSRSLPTEAQPPTQHRAGRATRLPPAEPTSRPPDGKRQPGMRPVRSEYRL